MIVTLREGADPAAVARALAERGLWVDRYDGDGAAPTAFLVRAGSPPVDARELAAIAGVAGVASEKTPWPRVDAQPRRIEVGPVVVGAPGAAAPVVMAGPCSVESPEQIERIAAALAARGVRVLRGGAYKPRTSPYAFAGHGEAALGWLAAAARRHGMAVVTEALAAADAERVAAAADLVQIGSRNMQNFELLRAAGRTGRPLLLKRGMAATVDEWLLAAEHALVAGAPAVLLCERGVRGFDPSTRNLLDLGAVALLARAHGLAVIADPSHGAGRRDLVVPLGRAALAAGAAGLLIEVHDAPGQARSDGPQALRPAEIEPLIEAARREHA